MTDYEVKQTINGHKLVLDLDEGWVCSGCGSVFDPADQAKLVRCSG